MCGARKEGNNLPMNTTDKNKVIHPQTVEIPQPLEVQHSISDDLVVEMLRVASFFTKNPDKFDGSCATMRLNGCGCVLAHLTGATWSNSTCMDDFSLGLAKSRWPQHHAAFKSIYAYSPGENAQWAVARIETFLRTGE